MPPKPEDSTIAHISTPPPTPHELALTLIILNLFPPTSINHDVSEKWVMRNSAWMEAVLRMIAAEIYHLSEPATYASMNKNLKDLTNLAPDPQDTFVRRTVDQLAQMGKIFDDVQHGFEVIDSIPNMCWETAAEDMNKTRITYNSPLGQFLRKIHLSYRVLDFRMTLGLREDLISWVNGDRELTREEAQLQKRKRKEEKRRAQAVECDEEPREQDAEEQGLNGEEDDEIPDEKRWDGEGGIGYGFSLKKEGRRTVANKVTEMDDLLETRLTVLQEYQKACHKGDYSLALSSLEKFYSYRFPPNDKMRHHHALLQVASFHYATGGLEMAKEAIDEATRGARTAGDVQCLKHCLSLTKRLKAEMIPAMSTVTAPGQPPHRSDVGEDTINETPLDELWSVKQRLDLGESIPAAFDRVTRAIGRQQIIQKAKAGINKVSNPALVEVETEQNKKDKLIPEGSMVDDALLHSVQASLWELIGSNTLAALHEDLALKASTSRPDIELTVCISKSRRLTRASRCQNALAMLLQPHLTANMSLHDYHRWSDAVWDVLEVDVTRRGDRDALDFIKSTRLPTHSYRQRGVGGPLRVLHDPGQHVSHDFFFRDALDAPRRGVDHLSGLLEKAEAAEKDGPAPFAALPYLLQASHIASTLKAWSVYRSTCVKLADVISRLQGSMNPFRTRDERQQSMLAIAVNQIEPIWDQIMRSEDDEMIWTGSSVLLRYYREQHVVDKYEQQARLSLRLGYRLQSRQRLMDTLMVMGLFENEQGHEAERDACASLWAGLRDGAGLIMVAERFPWVKDPRPSKETEAEEEAIVFDLPFLLEVRNILLDAGVRIASD